MALGEKVLYDDKAFIDGVARKDCVIGVIGLGYVGLPLVLAFHDKGFPTIGFDIDPLKTKMLMNGQSYIGHIPSKRVGRLTDEGRFNATTSFTKLSDVDAIIICVPTPLTSDRAPDLSHIKSTAVRIAPLLREGQLIVLESTTYPGTTREILIPLLEEGSGLTANEDFFVAFSPEREDPGNKRYSTTKIPKVVGADNKAALKMASALYQKLTPDIVEVSSTDTAEAVKITENIFRAVNIALVNELKLVFGAMDIDIWEVIDAAKTKPFGFMPFYPGPGLGGHCIPIDPFYLSWRARKFDSTTHFVELAGEINRKMPSVVVANLTEALSERQQKAIRGAKILVVGVAYKKNIEDVRGSPALTIIEQLQKRGAIVEYYDPYVQQLPATREFLDLAGMYSVVWTKEKIREFDAVLIATDHDKINWKLLAEHATLILDTRNRLKSYMISHGNKIVKS